ncbi:MAG TPA: ABC transporter ATP-binding protein [Stellaceae bacterium]|nr:ABC transporter ATP-binding protein [Stellaceae bacterium]
MSEGALLDIRGLHAGYGKKEVVRGVDLEVGAGEIVLVLGHNGAGKTTLMRAVFGLHEQQTGRVLFDGQAIAGRRPAEIVKLGLAFVPQGHGVFRSLSVRDNLALGAFTLKQSGTAPLATVYELFPVLAERARQLAGTLSGGQQQMLAIGMALMHSPRLIILDEPSIGLAPNLVAKVMGSIATINQRFGTTLVMVEQNLRDSLKIASRVVVLKRGAKIYDGAPAPLEDRVELMKLY